MYGQMVRLVEALTDEAAAEVAAVQRETQSAHPARWDRAVELTARAVLVGGAAGNCAPGYLNAAMTREVAAVAAALDGLLAMIAESAVASDLLRRAMASC